MEVHRKVEELLGIPKTALRKIKDGEICNQLGQGFPAWVITYHGDGQEVSKQACDEWCVKDYAEEEGECPGDHDPAYWVKVSMDTTYGYRGENGEDCSRLHARVMIELGNWLAERGVGLIWQNEYAGTYHEWNDAEAIQRFLGGGEEAGNWFFNIVSPVLRAEAAAAGANIEFY